MADAADRSAQLQEEHMQRAMAAREAARPARPSAEVCVECDEPIPARRQELLPGVQLCCSCQEIKETWEARNANNY